MEDTLQRVFGILLAVVVFFLLPLYMAFEKKDDISYSMALRITSNFVDNIANKGYISKEMYLDYVSDLALTDNAYEITFQHTAKKYYPVIYGNKGDGTKVKYDYTNYKDDYDDYLKGNTVVIDTVSYKQGTTNTLLLNYSMEQIQHTEKEILGYLEGYIIRSNDIEYALNDGTKVYPMSKGDEFTVVIKNTNTTIASILFNTLTMGINQGENTKVYINYGGTVQNESYRKNILIGESTDVNDTMTEEEKEVTLADQKNGIVMGIDHPVNIIYGDINSDGVIDIKDSSLLKRYLENGGSINTQLADLNFDGYISSSDSDIMGKYLSGNIDQILCTDKTTINFYVKFKAKLSSNINLQDYLVAGENNTIDHVETVISGDGYSTYKVTVKANTEADYIKLKTNEIVSDGVTYGAKERVVKILQDTPLTVSITTNETSPTKNNIIEYTIKFNRAVTNFEENYENNIEYNASHIQEFTKVSDDKYIVKLVSTGSGTQTILVKQGVCIDKYGNSNEQSNQISIYYDPNKPVISYSNWRRNTAGDAININIKVKDNYGEVTLKTYIKNMSDSGEYELKNTRTITGCESEKNVTYTISGISSNKVYEITVEITDKAGNSGKSVKFTSTP